jgi:hypothetical protein
MMRGEKEMGESQTYWEWGGGGKSIREKRRGGDGNGG